MPVRKCANGKWRIGSGDCMYKSKASAERAYKAYLAKKYSERKDMHEKLLHVLNELEEMLDTGTWGGTRKPADYQKRNQVKQDLDMLNTKPAWQSIVKSLVEQPERSISFIKQIIPFNKELERILIEQLKNIKAQEAA